MERFMNQPPLPEPVTISPQIVQRWQNVPAERLVGSGLSKADWDNLFFCLDHTIRASAEIQSALIAYSNGNIEEANERSWEASRRSVEAQNKLRQLMTAVMASSV